jgi:hypothetical protein
VSCACMCPGASCATRGTGWPVLCMLILFPYPMLQPWATHMQHSCLQAWNGSGHVLSWCVGLSLGAHTSTPPLVPALAKYWKGVGKPGHISAYAAKATNGGSVLLFPFDWCFAVLMSTHTEVGVLPNGCHPTYSLAVRGMSAIVMQQVKNCGGIDAALQARGCSTGACVVTGPKARLCIQIQDYCARCARYCVASWSASMPGC